MTNKIGFSTKSNLFLCISKPQRQSADQLVCRLALFFQAGDKHPVALRKSLLSRRANTQPACTVLFFLRSGRKRTSGFINATEPTDNLKYATPEAAFKSDQLWCAPVTSGADGKCHQLNQRQGRCQEVLSLGYRWSTFLRATQSASLLLEYIVLMSSSMFSSYACGRNLRKIFSSFMTHDDLCGEM